MDKITTSALIIKFALASEEACKCEDENFFRSANLYKGSGEPVTTDELIKVVRAATDFSRFSSIRTICKVLQELGIVEDDVDVFNNEQFKKVLTKAYLNK